MIFTLGPLKRYYPFLVLLLGYCEKRSQYHSDIKTYVFIGNKYG